MALVLGQEVHAVEKKNKPLTTQQVRKENGQVVERLILPPSINEPSIDQPVAAEIWAKRSMDPAWMAELARNPKLFTQWLDAVTEPRYMTALATMTAHGRAKTQVIDPELLQKLSPESGQGSLQNWAAASMDPRFYLTLFSRMANPDKALRWASCSWTADLAKAGQAGLAAAGTPGSLDKWLKRPLPESVPATPPVRTIAY